MPFTRERLLRPFGVYTFINYLSINIFIIWLDRAESEEWENRKEEEVKTFLASIELIACGFNLINQHLTAVSTQTPLIPKRAAIQKILARDYEKYLMSDNHVVWKFHIQLARGSVRFSDSRVAQIIFAKTFWVAIVWRSLSHMLFFWFYTFAMFLSALKCHNETFHLIIKSLQAAAGLDLKENLAGGPWPYPPVYPGYDAALAGYHFNG